MTTLRKRLAARLEHLRRALLEGREAARVRELRRLEQDFLPPLLEIQDTPPSPHKRMVLWALLALLSLALLWSWLGRVSVVATAAGRFIPNGRLQVVQPLELGVVKAIRVQAGQQVRAGDTLVELDTEALDASQAAVAGNLELNEARQRRLAGQLAGRAPDAGLADAGERGLWQAELDAHRNQVAIARAAVREAEADLAAGEAMLANLANAVAIADSQVADAKALADLGALARNDYLREERDRLARHGDLASQRGRVAAVRAHLASARADLARLDAERRVRLFDQVENARQQQYALAESQVKVAHELAAQRLRAPVAGTVQAVNITSLGEVVSPKQDVVTIVPRDVPLIVEIRVANQDAGFVKVGQPVEVKVDAFPFMQYGVLPGRLTWISPDAETDNQQGLYYRAWIETDALALARDGRTLPMRPGMAVTVDVKTGERRIIEFFLSPLLKNLKESVSVR
ncbi:HlyD family type I secretion periplasmic adaptor subunit [Parasulfuritortus cantonensis]|uniref:Membrane fusion protein (MFP) family protein n=1 Tax=Parasulfuritortus cantonensis TaxID=2528202 RepID=A0A4R1BGK3_9PROT|nr:HlyD family type I secretion periplasmic adaptor subunit [Parasulfuritortus cantonensis]TCJ16321.1 HlyD family type I secretion periplasmic adaptor subunit [Parasulfuritortus cantonensis]